MIASLFDYCIKKTSKSILVDDHSLDRCSLANPLLIVNDSHLLP